MTLSLIKIVVGRNECQKLKECDEICNAASFNACFTAIFYGGWKVGRILKSIFDDKVAI